jgi:hypothetical protein
VEGREAPVSFLNFGSGKRRLRTLENRRQDLVNKTLSFMAADFEG